MWAVRKDRVSSRVEGILQKAEENAPHLEGSEVQKLGLWMVP